MATGDKAMEDFKEEIRRDLKEMTSGITSLSDSVQKMVTLNAVNSVKEANQTDLNGRVITRLTKLEDASETLALKRAEEKQSREFLMKHWPWLLILALGLAGAISAVVSGAARNLIS